MSFDALAWEHELADRRARVEAALAGFLPDTPTETAVIREAMAYSLLAPAKRLRPLLVLLACEAVGGDAASEATLSVAVAYEFIHTYSLIHDDLPAMDDDDLRRGQPTSHKKFGEAIAVLAGDALLTHAFVLVARVPDPAIAAALVRELVAGAGVSGMIGGQVADLLAEREPDAATPERLRFIHRHKTAALLASAVRAGALVGGASDVQQQALAAYGESLGLAFQVVDDILDVTATAEALGKTPGKDARAAKLTYPRVYGLPESRAIAARLIDQAVAALSEVQNRHALEHLARYVGARSH